MNFMNLTAIFSCGNIVDMANTNSLRPILDRNPLRSDGANYSDWLRNLRNVLKRERKEYVLTTPLPEGEAMPPEFIEEKVKKGKGKRKPKPKKSNKGKGVVADQPKAVKVIPADAECYECHGKGHWRRDCPSSRLRT